MEVEEVKQEEEVEEEHKFYDNEEEDEGHLEADFETPVKLSRDSVTQSVSNIFIYFYLEEIIYDKD